MGPYPADSVARVLRAARLVGAFGRLDFEKFWAARCLSFLGARFDVFFGSPPPRRLARFSAASTRASSASRLGGCGGLGALPPPGGRPPKVKGRTEHIPPRKCEKAMLVSQWHDDWPTFVRLSVSSARAGPAGEWGASRHRGRINAAGCMDSFDRGAHGRLPHAGLPAVLRS